MRTFEEIRADIRQALAAHDVDKLRRSSQEAAELGTTQASAYAQTGFGNVARFTGDYTASLEHYERGLALFSELGNKHAMAGLCANLGDGYELLGFYTRALEYLERAYALFNEIGEIDNCAVVRRSIGTVHHLTGDLPTALDMYHRALEVHIQQGNRDEEARDLASIGNVHVEAGEPERALDFYERALAIVKEIGDRRVEAITIKNIGVQYQLAGQYARALAMYDEALALAIELQDMANITNSLVNIAETCLHLGDEARARRELEKASYTPLDNPRERSGFHRTKARLLETSGDLDGAREELLKALDVAEEAGIRTNVVSAHHLLRELARKSRDFDAYVEHNDAYLRLREEIQGKDATQKMAVMDAERRMEVERREREKERALLYGALPETVATRMLRGEDVSGDLHDNTAVLFLDIVGFTSHSRSLEPRILTDLLDTVFQLFDDLCDDHDVTKIKTIGDAYLAVAFPGERTAEERITHVALGIMRSSFCWPDESPLQFRIGVHSGPLVAGVIGKRRLQYDVWGDTVNTASRMESTSEPGRIQASHEFIASLGEGGWIIESRGSVNIKGRGEMNTYWLKGA